MFLKYFIILFYVNPFTICGGYVIIFILLFQGVIIIEILKLSVGDTLELKKPHTCGNKLFKVMRVGSDVRIACLECGRDLTLDRIKLEKSIKKIQSEN